MEPRGADRIVYTNDIPSPFEWVPYDPDADALRRQVDLLAANGVDLYAQDVFHGVSLFETEQCDYYGHIRKNRDWSEFKFHQCLERGLEPISIWADRCHHHGMKFIGGFRMNDRHSQGIHERFMSRFLSRNRQWWLKEFAGGFDYSFPQVRDWLFDIMKQFVTRFAADGMEFNFMRSPYVFPTNESKRKQPILTDFMRRVRAMIDQHAAARGAPLILGAWTPQSLDECHHLGLDVPAWIAEGLLDYVVPGDFGSADMNMPLDEFARVTRDSSCYLYPAIHPRPSRRHHPRTLLSRPAHRAAARNYYAQGADGVAMFNYIYHWDAHHSLYGSGPKQRYPSALADLRELRDPRAVDRGCRHYVFLPMTDVGSDYLGIRARHELFVGFTREPWKPGRGSQYQQRVFRMAESCGEECNARLRFRARGLRPAEHIEVHFNGAPVPDDRLTRSYHPDGRGGGWDDGLTPTTGPMDYTVCEFVPTAPAAHGVEHVLGIEVTRSGEPTWTEDGALDQMIVDEVEMVVTPGGEDADAIFAMTRERLPAPLKVAAGYHPFPLAAWREKCRTPTQVDGDDGSLGETIEAAALAQRFILAQPCEIGTVDVLLQPQPAGTPDAAGTTVAMTLCHDDAGRPGAVIDPEAARSTFNPMAHADELPCSLQGYYAFRFPRRLALASGSFWIVLEHATDRRSPMGYQPLLSPNDRYPEGIVMVRPCGSEQWRPHPHGLFFGVHEHDANQETST